MNNVYFSIGDAVAGLGIFLLIPQFLKPIYVFRLRVIGIGLRTLYAAAALGFMCVMIAAIVPNFDNIRPAFLGVSLVWEVIGGLLYATSYSALGWVYIFPARVSPRSITKYVRAGANLLASGTEGDRVEFAADVLANIKRLIRIADRPSASEHASHAANDSAACSESFLRLLADPVFCKTLVVNLPWDAARLLRAFSEERPKAQVGRAFVSQITREWFVSTESTGASEVDWRGFSDTPELPDAAFGDRFLSRHYLPWESLTASDIVTIDVGLLDRIYRATRLTIDEEIADRFSVQSYNVARLQESFEALSRRLYLLKKAEQDVAPCANILGHAVKYVVERTRKYCATAKGADGKALYAQADTVAGFSALDSIAEMVITVLENTAYEFGGFDDKFWPMAREIWDSVLPLFGAQ